MFQTVVTKLYQIESFRLKHGKNKSFSVEKTHWAQHFMPKYLNACQWLHINRFKPSKIRLVKYFLKV